MVFRTTRKRPTECTSMSYFTNIPSSFTVAGIPAPHYGSYLGNFNNSYPQRYTEFYSSLEKLTAIFLEAEVAKCPRYIFFCGTPGSGKTHFMVGLYRAMVEKLGYSQGDGAFFMPFVSLAFEIINTFQQHLPIRSSMVGFTQARWLFLDDFTASERVFKEGSLEFICFRDILLDRYEKSHTLITSSNLNAEDLVPELDRMYGGYITSRLSESLIIQFPPVDLRKK